MRRPSRPTAKQFFTVGRICRQVTRCVSEGIRCDLTQTLAEAAGFQFASLEKLRRPEVNERLRDKSRERDMMNSNTAQTLEGRCTNSFAANVFQVG